ncbi:MAG: sulfatase-like hydrolase/transferase [bacterium]
MEINKLKTIPNILFIITDQHHFKALSCLGHPVVKTPGIDGIAEDGIIFENTYCAAPICGPSRASIYTGEYPGRTQVFTNYENLSSDLDILPELLRQAGMQTALVGKLHLWPSEKSWGFEYKRFNDSPYDIYKKDEADYSDYITYLVETLGYARKEIVKRFDDDESSSDRLRFYLGSGVTDEVHHYNTWVADGSIDFIRNKRDDKPFFLHVGFFGPHQPMMSPEPWASMYKPEDIELPPQFYAEINDKPILEDTHLWRAQEFRDQGWTEETWKKVLAMYYGQVSQIDYHISRIVSVLKEQKIYDNTIIIFTADHGDYNGQFGLLEKGTMYEGSVRVPFIIRDPDFPKGVRRDRLVNNFDLYRTLLERCGIKVAQDTPSRNLSSVMEGQYRQWQNVIKAALYHQTMLRRDNLKLMRKDSGKNGEIHLYEFYDFSDSPSEMINEYSNPEYRNAIKEMKKEIDEWHITQNYRICNCIHSFR